MLKKGQKLYSILFLRCPECHEGKLFHHNLYNPKKLGEMEKTCESCGLKYAKEPGFFFGAAYVSYGVTVAFAIAFFLVALFLYPEGGWQVHLGAVIAGLLLTFPVAHALSRSIWLNIFFKYREKG